MNELSIHEVANLFPAMSADEYAELLSDIRANGLHEALWTYQGALIDGRHRYRACQELGIEPQTREWDGRGSLVTFVVGLNLHRRHLTSSQRAMLALEVEKLFAKEAASRVGGRPKSILETEAARLAHPSEDQEEKGTEIFQYLSKDMPNRNETTAAAQAASVVGTNSHYVADAKKIAASAPELVERVKSGDMSIPEAKKLASAPAPVRNAAIEKLASGQAKNAQDAILQVKREERRTPEERIASRPAAPSTYRVILADPPWPYTLYDADTGHGRSAESHYSTMSIDDIAAMPVGELAAPDCALFMWVTWPNLFHAEQIGKAWGFEYRTCAFTWAKLNKSAAGRMSNPADDSNWFMSMGSWTRANTEVCLLFVKGAPPRFAADVRQLIVAPVREHSRKPDEQYGLIERLLSGPYLELFARRKFSEKWNVWGNQVESDIAFAGIGEAR